MLRLRVPVGETRVSTVQNDPAARSRGLRDVREGVRGLDRGMRLVRGAHEAGPCDVGGRRGVPQPRLRPRHVRGAGPGARREGLPGLRRCRTV